MSTYKILLNIYFTIFKCRKWIPKNLPSQSFSGILLNWIMFSNYYSDRSLTTYQTTTVKKPESSKTLKNIVKITDMFTDGSCHSTEGGIILKDARKYGLERLGRWVMCNLARKILGLISATLSDIWWYCIGMYMLRIKYESKIMYTLSWIRWTSG